ncbi:MAG: hypothetical protein H7Z71_03070 [Moraxellaceae bacterium]|nr:hypothetical protein [Pseudobdellovibrionaceae bacterium]
MENIYLVFFGVASIYVIEVVMHFLKKNVAYKCLKPLEDHLSQISYKDQYLNLLALGEIRIEGIHNGRPVVGIFRSSSDQFSDYVLGYNNSIVLKLENPKPKKKIPWYHFQAPDFKETKYNEVKMMEPELGVLIELPDFLFSLSPDEKLPSNEIYQYALSLLD